MLLQDYKNTLETEGPATLSELVLLPHLQESEFRMPKRKAIRVYAHKHVVYVCVGQVRTDRVQ